MVLFNGDDVHAYCKIILFRRKFVEQIYTLHTKLRILWRNLNTSKTKTKLISNFTVDS